MATDIHIVIERHDGKEWIGIKASDDDLVPMLCARRDYEFFEYVASQKPGRGYVPKGFPTDASVMAKSLYSPVQKLHFFPSHMELRNFCFAHAGIRPQDNDATANLVSTRTGLRDMDEAPRRAVFWFDM